MVTPVTLREPRGEAVQWLWNRIPLIPRRAPDSVRKVYPSDDCLDAFARKGLCICLDSLPSMEGRVGVGRKKKPTPESRTDSRVVKRRGRRVSGWRSASCRHRGTGRASGLRRDAGSRRRRRRASARRWAGSRSGPSFPSRRRARR